MLTLGPFESADDLTNWCIDHLQRNGFVISTDRSGWETPAELRARVAAHIPCSTFAKRLRAPGCPAFRSIRGNSGRILKLRSHPALESFLTQLS